MTEGSYLISPFTDAWSYDLRTQSDSATMGAILADGATAQVAELVTTYRIDTSGLLDLNRQVGPEYYDVVIAPLVQSAVGEALGRLPGDQLDSPHLAQIQAQVTARLATAMAPWHVALIAVQMSDVGIALPKTQQAILATGVAEQGVLTSQRHLDIDRATADTRRQEASGVAAALLAVAPTLSPLGLKDQEQRAWGRLIASPDAKVYVLSPEDYATIEVAP
jgi:regulator of protease activity HflC (stomatin/prohibitin superfamily)